MLLKQNIMTNFKVSFLILFTFILGFFSCSNELENHNQDSNSSDIERVHFSSQSYFIDTWIILSEMTKPELIKWIDLNNISLSRNAYKNPNIEDERGYFTALFNIKNECQIGDSIIWYNNGKLILLSSNADDNEAASNKLNPSKCLLFGEIEKEIIPLKQDDILKTRGSLGDTGIDKSTSNQTEFFSTANPKCEFKYVYELVAYRNNMGVNTIYELVFDNKLEYITKGASKKKWYEASEKRKCTSRLNGSITAEIQGVNVSINRPFNVSRNMTDELSYNSSLVLARTIESNGYHRFTRWTYNISCNMTQEIIGDPNSKINSSFSF